MKRSHRYYRRALIRYWFALVAGGLIVGAAPMVDPAAKALATSAVAQADDEKRKATDEVQKRVFSGPQPGEKVMPFKVLRVKADQAKELEIVKKTDERTTLICFVHRLSNELEGKGIQQRVDSSRAMHATGSSSQSSDLLKLASVKLTLQSQKSFLLGSNIPQPFLSTGYNDQWNQKSR